MASETADTIVIGAGVIGLAIARELAQTGREVLVLESNSSFGMETSSRNSGVIHAGIYYQPASLKARCCIDGKQMLYDYCRDHHVAHNACGKLIVAKGADEIAELEVIESRARANNVLDLSYLSGVQLQAMEPAISAEAALYSPSTGIIDSHGLMAALVADITDAGGQVISQTYVESVSRLRGNFLISCRLKGEVYQFTSRVLVNAAGLGAQALAQKCDFLASAELPPLYLCKGSYVAYKGKNPFRHLIYPVPEKNGAGLGIHATIDLAGQLKFGPDVEYIEAPDYDLSGLDMKAYFEAIQGYFPSVEYAQLEAAYAGIRPKLQAPGGAVKDFVIESATQHGVPGFIQLFGIESPGLTSCLAIGEYVAELLVVEDYY